MPIDISEQDARDAERMLALVAFFRSRGVCAVCALRFAIGTVEREAGREYTPPSEACPPCKVAATKHWNERPKP